jgi:hypothetical protein
METAKVMSELYGTAYMPMHSKATSRRFYQDNNQNGQNFIDHRQGQGWEIRPALAPSEMMSLPKEKVLALTQKERQYRFIGDRLDPIHLFDQLAPPPVLPKFQSGQREYTSWVAFKPGEDTDARLAGDVHF